MKNKLISAQKAAKMKAEYHSKIAPLIKESKSEDDYSPTEFAYIEIETLREYMALLEDVEKQNNMKISGLRIYFAAYPEQENQSNPAHNGRETFFFAPTMDLTGETNITEEQRQCSYLQNVPFSILPVDPTNKYVGDFEPIEELLFCKDVRKTASESSRNVENGIEETSLLLNDLYICPPPKKPD